MRLSQEKTKVVHIDEGFEFLGFRIQRQIKQGTVNKRYAYTWPSRKALATVMATIRAITAQGTNKPLSGLLDQINPVLRGWASYFRHGCSKATFGYLHQFTWRRVVNWLRRKHRTLNWKQLRRRYLPMWWPTDGARTMFDTRKVPVTRYRYRGTNIPTPWQPAKQATA
jgi:RNA-directed DNA polymerase